jgi:probable F420-dependent oxidoreductase
VLVERFGPEHDVVRTARRAEGLGYATLLVRDHLAEQPFGHQLAPLTTMAVAAASTRRLRVGTLVLAVDYRHPAVLAKELATLHRLSGGRVEIGLGAGWLREEYERIGMPFDRDGRRVDRLAEALRVLKGLFAGAPLTFAGAHYRFDGYDAYPAPLQRPHPPILVGAGGRRMLAPIVDGVVAYNDDPATRSPESYLRKIEWLQETAGDRFDQLELSTVVGRSPTRARPASTSAKYPSAARTCPG